MRAGYVTLKDSTAPFVKERWMGTAVLFLIYCIRVYMINGWCVVAESRVYPTESAHPVCTTRFRTLRHQPALLS